MILRKNSVVAPRKGRKEMNTFLALCYTFLWSSAAVATKFGLEAGPPLILASLRFSMAGVFLWIPWSVKHKRLWPEKAVTGPLAILGLLNTTLYLGASFEALRVVSAGLFNLFVAVNPFFVLLLDRIWLGRTVRPIQWSGFAVATIGLAIGSWQAVRQFSTPWWAIGLMVGGQMSMALGSIYFHQTRMTLSSITVNTWQLIWGAIFLWPFAFLLPGSKNVTWNLEWWGGLAWLVGAVSIGAMLLWFRLLRRGAAQASMWLLLTPVIGYVLGLIFLHESFTQADMISSIFVMIGLILFRTKKGARLKSSLGRDLRK
jgi:drug/metabolite transporter (DMT)-like permease